MKPEPLDMPLTTQAMAAYWMTLKRSGGMSELDARELKLWLDRDPANAEALGELEAIWEEAGEIREDPAILALRELNLKTFNRPARVRLLVGAIAASLAIAVLGGWAAVSSGVLADIGLFHAGQEQLLRTGVGQTTTVSLPDGSVVTLDTDTVLRARESGRRRLVDLERGRAFFRVAKDQTRPFIVTAAGKSVTATGTAFEVRRDPGRLEVTLIEGRVKVEAARGQSWEGQQTADMRAGWRLTALDDRRWMLRQIDVNKETSWLSGRLTFFSDPLAEAAAEVNRYSDRKVIVDPKIAKAPIVGVFKTGDVDTFVRGVELSKIGRVAHRADGSIELTARR